MRILIAFTLAVLGAVVVNARQRPSKAEAVDVCRLLADPAANNRTAIVVSGLVLHGFEEFSFSDPKCSRGSGIWLEYGGPVNSDTVFCCGTPAGAPRGRTLVVEGITLPLVDDALFRRFDDRIRKRGASGEVAFRATLRGHFFAGQKQHRASGDEYYSGYGHLGCCSLMVIEQVLSVDDSARR